MNKTRILNLLGLCMRSRNIVLGQEFVLKELARAPKSILFLASDAGENMKKKVKNKALTYDAILIDQFTSSELSTALGKENRRIVLVTDKGFIKKFLEYVNS